MNQTPSEDDLKDPRVARREKMRQLIELGVDPFGGRFDNRDMNGDCRERAKDIKFVKEDGTQLDLPDFDDENTNYKQWKSDTRPGRRKRSHRSRLGTNHAVARYGQADFLDPSRLDG